MHTWSHGNFAKTQLSVLFRDPICFAKKEREAGEENSRKLCLYQRLNETLAQVWHADQADKPTLNDRSALQGLSMLLLDKHCRGLVSKRFQSCDQ